MLPKPDNLISYRHREFIVTYVNRATQELLGRNAEAFRKVWPGFDPARIVGMCIDTFHRNPAHQRRMLADTSQLPFRTDISVGELKFALNVGASYDARGVYDGNVLEWMDVTLLRTQQGQLAAIDKAQAVIDFSLEGRIQTANPIFLSVMGYTLDEIRGQRHSMFVDPAYRQTAEYRAFWEKLGRGEHESGQFKRLGRGGKEVWIQAIYSPILDQNGRPFKAAKYATDITEKVAHDLATQRIVDDMIVFLGALSEGDLTRRIHGEHTGMFAQIKDNANNTSIRLAEIVTGIVDAAGTIATASAEISSGSADLASRTEGHSTGGRGSSSARRSAPCCRAGWSSVRARWVCAAYGSISPCSAPPPARPSSRKCSTRSRPTSPRSSASCITSAISPTLSVRNCLAAPVRSGRCESGRAPAPPGRSRIRSR